MDSFNHFIPLNELEVIESFLVFVEENQGVCWWGIKLGTDDPIVYQQSEENGECYSEELYLSQFISLLLFYQCAQGGYEKCGLVQLPNSKLSQLLEKEWKLVVHHNGLVIYAKPFCLIWYLREMEEEVIDDIYLSAYSSNYFTKNIEVYKLLEL